MISIEDKRFATNSGIDIRGIARAFVQDIRHEGTVQGASTIEEQFIKNALQAQSHRTIFEKLREAALAYQLSHKWSKEKIITAYLNTIYFGNGAYGIEAAAQTYFGHEANHLGCGTPGHELCVQQLQPWEAALLAGIIQSPTGYDPVEPSGGGARTARRRAAPRCYEQGYLTRAVYEESINQALPAAENVQAPAGADGRRRRRRLLHELGAAAGDRTLRRAARLRRRPAHQDDARPRTAARRRTGGQRLPRLPRRPDAPRSSRSKTRPARCARWSAGATTTKARSTSPPRASASRAPRSRPSTSRRRWRTASRPTRCGAPRRRNSSCPTRAARNSFVVHNDEGAYTGANTLTERDRLLGQLDLRRSRAQSGHQTDRAPGPPHGHHDAAVDQPRDDDRRPDRRRDAARHGPRL